MAEHSRKEDDATRRPRRIRTDPIFFALIGVISATYVLLICAMLLADAAYVATSEMREYVRLDFSTNAEGVALEPDTEVKSQFEFYGLAVASGDDRSVVVYDSNRPLPGDERLGSPNEDFGGTGEGDGGRRKAPGANALPLGRVLVVASRLKKTESRNATEDAETTKLAAKLNHLRQAIGHLESAGQLELAKQLVVLAEQANTELEEVRKDVVQPKATLDLPGSIELRWQDPAYVQEIQLLDAAADGGTVEAYDQEGEQIASFEIENLGRNGYQEIRIEKENVARLVVNLPNGAAVAELAFSWAGHIRADWERDSPFLAKLVYNPITKALGQEEIQYSIKLSLISCTITAIISLWFAVPIGYLLSRYRFPGRNLVDSILDVPIVLPPLVVGLSLLILFKFFPQGAREAVVYEIPAVILAQFAVACAFAVRTMRATFDQIDARREQVALTLGCSRAQAFGMVVLPESMRGVLTAGTLAWARALGEFGPLLIFAGATRMKTEVLSTSVFLEMNVGNVGAAVSVSLIMVVAAVIVLIIARMWGSRTLSI